MSQTPCPPDKPRALLGWRVLAMVYDALPVIAMWFVVSAIFTVGYTFIGQHDVRENIQPYSLLAWLLWLCCWVVTGAYATISWRRGGQTLGMRPWRLQVVGADGQAASTQALWRRYAMGSVSLLALGLGFVWALFDRERLTWHDRISNTRMQRLPKVKR